MSEPTIHVYGGSPQGRRRRELTVKEYARLERVSERTVWNWIDKKAVQLRRTPGGGVRIVVTTEEF